MVRCSARFLDVSLSDHVKLETFLPVSQQESQFLLQIRKTFISREFSKKIPTKNWMQRHPFVSGIRCQSNFESDHRSFISKIRFTRIRKYKILRTNRGINSRVQNRIFFSETKTNENKKCFLRCNGRINSTLEHSSIRTRKILMIQNFFSSSSKSRMIRIKAENFLAIRDKLNI